MPIGQFALVFSIAYAALKWNYILPIIWNQTSNKISNTSLSKNQKLLFQNWIFAITGIAITLSQSLLNVPKISKETSYLTGLVALATVVNPKSKSWMAAATAIHLELINVLVTGSRNHKIAAGIVISLVTVATALNAKKTLVATLMDYLDFVMEV